MRMLFFVCLLLTGAAQADPCAHLWTAPTATGNFFEAAALVARCKRAYAASGYTGVEAVTESNEAARERRMAWAEQKRQTRELKRIREEMRRHRREVEDHY